MAGPLVALFMTLGGAPGCLAPASAEALLATGFATPRQTVVSYQTFLRADLPLREFRCFSMGFKERYGISALTYAEAREELVRKQPWLRLLAKAEIVGEGADGEARHWIDLRSHGRTVRVKLVREDFYEILAGDQLLEDGDASFGRAAQLTEEGSGSRLTVRLTLAQPPAQLAGLSQIRLLREWKIDQLSELQDDQAKPPSP